jgi:DNA polymerase
MSDFVSPDGPNPADIVVCGESPGKAEVAEGMGFVGPSGKVLWGKEDVLTLADIPREVCYVTNVVKTPCPDAEWDTWSAWDQRQAIEDIRREVSNVHPTVVLAFGVRASKALVPGFESMTRQHGEAVIGFEARYWAMPMWHPAAYLRGNRAVLGDLIQDALKAKELLTRPLRWPEPVLQLQPSIPLDTAPTTDEFLEAWPERVGTMEPGSGKAGKKCTLCGEGHRPLKRYGDRVFALTLCMRDAIITSEWAETIQGKLSMGGHQMLGAIETFVEKLERLIAQRAKECGPAQLPLSDTKPIPATGGSKRDPRQLEMLP